MTVPTFRGEIKYKEGNRVRVFTPSSPGRTENGFISYNAEIRAVDGGWVVTCAIQPLKEISLLSFSAVFPCEYRSGERIFVNGYQSWTESRYYRQTEKQKKLFFLARFFKLHYYGDSCFFRRSGRKGVFDGFQYGYISREDNSLFFTGSLDERKGYTVCRFDSRKERIRIVKELPEKQEGKTSSILSFVILQGSENEVLDKYFSLRKTKPPELPPVTGWTSWYNYYTKISEEIILRNLESYSRENVPSDFFQIDDGFQTAVGDWLSLRDNFPRGMKFLAGKIHAAGYKAGLWLAPFICESRSSLFKDHPQWILRNRKGKPVPAGFNPGWSGVFYALDIYNDEVRDYLKTVFDTVSGQWGFDLLKLDFLYAVCLAPPPGKTRGEVMADAVDFLVSIKGPVRYLGCGVPLESAFGKMEYCRIGSDVAPYWEDSFLKRVHYRERVSTINSLRSTIGRRHLNNRAFLNDPDVYFLRHDKIKMDPEEKYTLFLLNNIFGSLLFTSDDISLYSDIESLLYRAHFPVFNKEFSRLIFDGDCINADFKIGDWNYKLFSNLGSRKKLFTLPDGPCFKARSLTDSGKFLESREMTLKSRSSVLLFRNDGEELLAGDEGHVFPGSRFRILKKASDGRITAELHEKGSKDAAVYLHQNENGKPLLYKGRPGETVLELPERKIVKFII